MFCIAKRRNDAFEGRGILEAMGKLLYWDEYEMKILDDKNATFRFLFG